MTRRAIQLFLRVTIKRQIIQTKVVFVERTQAGVPVIRIINFLPGDFEKQFADALKQVGDVRNLIIDVRDNPGGRTDASINALAMLVRQGKLNVTLTREGDALVRDEVTAVDGWFFDRITCREISHAPSRLSVPNCSSKTRPE